MCRTGGDPFLRALGLYGYGYERSFSRRALRRRRWAAGLEAAGETAISFVPGWLWMADLCLTLLLPVRVAHVTAALLEPFAWLDRHVRAVRRDGYPPASVGVRRERR